MTIFPPEHGTVLVEGTPIECGSLGKTCTAEIEDGQPITLRQEPDAGYQFLRYGGDCDANGEATMSRAMQCSGTFVKAVASEKPAPPSSLPPAAPRRPNPGDGKSTAASVVEPAPAASTPPGTAATVPDVPRPTADAPPVAAADKKAPDLLTPEYYAKRDILQLVVDYCRANESRKPEVMKKIYPSVDTRKLKDQYGDLDWIKCTSVPPEDLDPQTAHAKNVAQFHFVMKQKLKAKSGGAPKDAEFDVTMVVSRKDSLSDWLIARADVAHKPKD